MKEPLIEILKDIIQLYEKIIRLVMLVKYRFRTPFVGEPEVVKAGGASGMK